MNYNHSVVNASLPLDGVSIQHLIEMRPAQARRFADLAGSHGVESWRLRAMLREIDKLIPPMDFGMINGENNPNNGKPHHWYSIGKECSRVVYLHIIRGYLPRDFDYDVLTAKLDKIASKYRADEAWVTENTLGGYVYRIWWD